MVDVSDEMELDRDEFITKEEELGVPIDECTKKVNALREQLTGSLEPLNDLVSWKEQLTKLKAKINEQTAPLTEETEGCQASPNEISSEREGRFDQRDELSRKVHAKIQERQVMKDVFEQAMYGRVQRLLERCPSSPTGQMRVSSSSRRRRHGDGCQRTYSFIF